MEFPHHPLHVTEPGDSDAPARGGKIRISPRKEKVAPAGNDEQAGAVPPAVRGARHRPPEPKVPFEQPLKTALANGPREVIVPTERHWRRHGILGFFRSRRKGHQRVVTFIFLPLAVLLASAVIFLILKNH